MAQVDALRRDPGPLPGRDLPASFLKHADEQSVCGLAAVLKAIHESGLGVDAFKDWGVIGAPKYPGRVLAGASMAKFFDQGVRGISPHVIPQNSLHSLSGVISVALEMGGPNVGAGGGRTALAEGLLTAFSLMADGRLPGMWLVATEWDREPLPQKNGRAVAEGRCHAVALMLSPLESAAEGLCLTLRPQTESPTCADEAGNEPLATASSLASALERQQNAAFGAAVWRLSMGWGTEVVLAKTHSS
jgi:hypothetical protein